jgi:hypothetical protein
MDEKFCKHTANCNTKLSCRQSIYSSTGLVNLYESVCPNFRQFSKKLFCVPMGILSRKMESFIIINYY